MLIENIEYDVLLERFKKILRQGGLKYTKQREVLLRALYHNDIHYTPESLYMEIKRNEPDLNVGIATVYRTLNLLEEAEMVTSISFGAAGKKYELANKPHHDHMICKNCGKIIEFENPIIERQQSLIAKEYGFKLTGHLMQLYGVCSECNHKIKVKI
ncbi:MAG: transcriptional repressor [Campylobacter sp.]|nr:transcriptional repressor [Campylobacter sp.]